MQSVVNYILIPLLMIWAISASIALYLSAKYMVATRIELEKANHRLHIYEGIGKIAVAGVLTHILLRVLKKKTPEPEKTA